MGTQESENGSRVLEVHSLGYSYGLHPALNQVSITVPAGRFVALLGANGAGKTTLFSIITGLYSAHHGSVSVMGHDLRASTLKALAHMGVVFQRSTLDMDLTVAQNLHYAAALQGIPKRDAIERVTGCLPLHGLDGLEARKLASLSGGQRRRVELARALLHEPQLLLLDEPTVGLDLQSRTDFVEHVKVLCRERRTGVLWATHLMDEVSSNDLVYILDSGEIIARGEVKSLLKRSRLADVTALFNSLVTKSAG